VTFGKQVAVFDSLGRSRGPLSISGELAFTGDISPDGRVLATGSLRDGVLRLWQRTGQERVIGREPNEARAVRFSPDGKLLATAGESGVSMWMLDDLRSAPLRGDANVIEVRFVGDEVLSVATDLTVRLWRAIEQPVQALAIAGGATRLAWRGNEIVVGDKRGGITWWAPATGATRHADGTERIDGLVVGERFVAGYGSGELGLWDPATLERQALPVPSTRVTSAAFDGDRLATASVDGTIRIWASGSVVQTYSVAKRPSVVAISRDGSLAFGGMNGATRLLTKAGERPIPVFDAAQLEFSPSGDRLAAADLAGRITILDLASGAASVYWASGGRYGALAFSPTGRWLAVMTNELEIRVIDLHRGDQRSLRGVRRRPSAIAFSSRSVLAVASADHTVWLWDIDAMRTRVLRHAEPVTDIAFSPDGARIATASGDRVRVWTVEGDWVPAGSLRAWLERSTTAALGTSDTIATPH
jgi:WD40 repeat protein